jgi:hypothetical protein
MNAAPAAVAAAVLTLALSACQPAGPTYAQDVKPILDGRCVNCHAAGGIAPFALDTFDDARRYASAIADSVEAGRMPPWKAGPADVAYLRNPSLTDAQKAAIAAWARQGTPQGDPARPGAPLPAVGGGLERVDLSLKMAEAYTPTQRPDDYRCFVLRWPKDQAVYVTGVNTVPGEAAQVHHLALYLVPPDAAALPAQWDAEDATPGYSCFGGPFGSRPQTFAVNLLTAWIPGYQGTTFPRGGGVLVEPGATVVMQVHYNVAGVPQPRADLTEVQFQLADTVARRLAYQPLLNVEWVAGQMKIPADAPEVPFTYAADPRAFFSLLGSPLDTSKGFTLEAVMFHMHQLGRRGELWLDKADKRRVKVLEIADWDFHWQNEYQLAEPVRFEPGDKLRVKCVFDNTAGRLGPGRPSAATNWGENSDEEMCVANILSSE